MGEHWYCRIVGQDVGPVTSEDLISMLNRGQISPDDPVRAGTSGPWRPVKEILGGTFSSKENTATATADASWFCRMLGDEFGPYTLRELREFAVQGQLSPKDEIRDGRSGPWSAAGTVAGIFDRPAGSSRDRQDEYGFMADIADLEDVGSQATPSSGRSSDDLLAGMADLEDAEQSAAPAASRSTDDLLAGMADLEDAAASAAPASPPKPQVSSVPQASPAPPTPAAAAAPPAGMPAASDPAALMGMLQSVAMMEMVQRLDSEYRRLRSQMTGAPIESPSSHGQPPWPRQPAVPPQAYGPQGYGPPPQQGWGPQPTWQSPPQPGWAPPQGPPAAPWPGGLPQATPPTPAASRPATPPVRLPEPPKATASPSNPAPAISAPAMRHSAPAADRPAPPPTSPAETAPKPVSDAGASRNAAANVMRDMAAAHIRSAQTPSRPVSRGSSGGGGGGLSLDLSSIDFTSKPFIIAAAIVGVLALGYFGMSLGLLSGLNAGPVYDETAKLFEEFKTASAKGAKGPEFAKFYESFKPQYTELYKKIGAPKPGTTAYKVKNAVGYLRSTVESMKMDLPKDEQAAYRQQLEQTLTQLKKELGR